MHSESQYASNEQGSKSTDNLCSRSRWIEQIVRGEVSSQPDELCNTVVGTPRGDLRVDRTLLKTEPTTKKVIGETISPLLFS